MKTYNIRMAKSEDIPAMRELMISTRDKGRIQFDVVHGNDFFCAFTPHGCETLVFSVCIDGTCVGMAAMSIREVFLDGRIQKVAYSSHLRIKQSYTSIALIRDLYAYIEDKTLQRHPDLSQFFASIMQVNQQARKLFTHKRSGLPLYITKTSYTTYCIPVFQPIFNKDKACVRMATKDDMPTLIEFWNQQQLKHDFFPALRIDNFQSIYPAVLPEDILIAEKNHTILGTIALWNQQQLRQVVVSDYPAALRIGSHLLPKFLPPKGMPLRMIYGALLCTADDSPKVAQYLTSEAIRKSRKRGVSFFTIGAAAQAPVNAVLNKFFSFKLKSHLYQVMPKSISHNEAEWNQPFVDVGTL